jgi:hypothetical protein
MCHVQALYSDFEPRSRKAVMHCASTMIAHKFFTASLIFIVCCSTPLDSSTAPPHSAADSAMKMTRSLSSLPRAVRESAGFHTKQWDRGWENIEATTREYGEEVVLDPIGGSEGAEGERACIIWLHGQGSCGQELAQRLGTTCPGACHMIMYAFLHHSKHSAALRLYESISVCV